MKKTLLIVAFLLACTSGYSQTSEELFGKWQFKDIYKTDSEKKGGDMIKQMLSTMVLEFNPDMSYSGTVIGINENGVWKIIDSSLELTNDGGGVSKWKILNFKKDEITLQFKSADIIMKKL